MRWRPYSSPPPPPPPPCASLNWLKLNRLKPNWLKPNWLKLNRRCALAMKFFWGGTWGCEKIWRVLHFRVLFYSIFLPPAPHVHLLTDLNWIEFSLVWDFRHVSMTCQKRLKSLSILRFFVSSCWTNRTFIMSRWATIWKLKNH